MQMKLGKLLAETKTGEKRQIEPEWKRTKV